MSSFPVSLAFVSPSSQPWLAASPGKAWRPHDGSRMHQVLVHTVVGEWILLHELTWEAVRLDRARAPFTLCDAVPGEHLLTDRDGQVVNTSQLLRRHIVYIAGLPWVQQEGADDMPLEKFRVAHVARYFRLGVPQLPDMVNIKACGPQTPQNTPWCRN